MDPNKSEVESKPVALEPGSAPAPAPEVVPSAASSSDKKVGALVLDSGGLIKNEISVSTLLSQAEQLYTIPAVISELKDEATRARIQPLLPFLKLRNPTADSSRFISDFARKTGDLSVLSRVDLQLLALTYELEKERNKGDWRLRNDPNQKTLNGNPPGREGETAKQEEVVPAETQSEEVPSVEARSTEAPENDESAETNGTTDVFEETTVDNTAVEAVTAEAGKLDLGPGTVSDTPEEASEPELAETPEAVIENAGNDEIEDDGEGEWITPSNLDKHRVRDKNLGVPQPIDKMLQVALLTTDNAMRNVALRINLNLLDPSFSRITYIKTWVLRCHTCMKICKEQKQFCPSCGHPTLTRVSVSTDASNNFKVHLKKNFQWNNRGNVYSIPKPVHGSASGKATNVAGGGKSGWGQELILAEDQKEYTRRVEEDRRTKYRDLMDEDYLPSILGGDKKGGHGKIKVGAGRSVNSKKRR